MKCTSDFVNLKKKNKITDYSKEQHETKLQIFLIIVETIPYLN